MFEADDIGQLVPFPRQEQSPRRLLTCPEEERVQLCREVKSRPISPIQRPCRQFNALPGGQCFNSSKLGHYLRQHTVGLLVVAHVLFAFFVDTELRRMYTKYW